MDMPLYNDEAKYFLADYHKCHNLEFKETPRFVVDLNLPPAQRWAEVIAHHADVLPRVEGYLQGMMLQIEKEAIGNSWIRKMFLSAYKFVKGTFKEVAVKICRKNPAIDIDEVQAVAELSKIPFEDFCMLQCAYEVAARCSSMVAELEDGSPCHARTMDWGALFLRDMSCQARE